MVLWTLQIPANYDNVQSLWNGCQSSQWSIQGLLNVDPDLYSRKFYSLPKVYCMCFTYRTVGNEELFIDNN